VADAIHPVKKTLIIVSAVLALLGAGGLLVVRDLLAPSTGGAVVVYCAAGFKTPVEVVAAQFKTETGVEVQRQYGGTATLLSAIQTARRGDLFLAADSIAIEEGRRQRLLREVIPVALQRPVLAVPKGNPKQLTTLESIQAEGVRLALTNPESAAVGRITKSVLGDRYEALASRAIVTKPTVNDIASDLSLGAVDAAIVWDSTVAQFPNLEAVQLPVLSENLESASIAVLSASTQSPAALRFARYLAAPDRGGKILQEMGFTPTAGDRWTPTPELVLYSGGVNRPAIESLLHDFSEREGVRVTTVFNGCGVLCASMKAMADSTDPKFPDAYYACDLCFVPPVAKFFPETLVLTETEIGVAVKKGNPAGIASVADLARPGLRVGLCNAEQSTLGFMTRGILSTIDMVDAVQKNVAVEVPTADFLINQLRAGALDAAIVYKVNAIPQQEHLDFLPIGHPGARAVQPFSIRADSPNRHLADRLLEFLREHRSRFEAAGFQWRGEEVKIDSAKIEVPEWLRPNKDQKASPAEHP